MSRKSDILVLGRGNLSNETEMPYYDSGRVTRNQNDTFGETEERKLRYISLEYRSRTSPQNRNQEKSYDRRVSRSVGPSLHFRISGFEAQLVFGVSLNFSEESRKNPHRERFPVEDSMLGFQCLNASLSIAY